MTDNSNKHSRGIERRLPTGSAWHGETNRAFFEGLAQEFELQETEIKKIADIENNLLTDYRQEWIYLLSLPENATDEEIKARLIEKGGITATDIQNALHRAGFNNLFVYPNRWNIDNANGTFNVIDPNAYATIIPKKTMGKASAFTRQRAYAPVMAQNEYIHFPARLGNSNTAKIDVMFEWDYAPDDMLLAGEVQGALFAIKSDYSTKKIECSIYTIDTPSAVYLNSTTALQKNEVYHIVFEYDGAEARLIINGNVEDSANVTGSIKVYDTEQDFSIFRGYFSTDYTYPSYIWDLKVYSNGSLILDAPLNGNALDYSGNGNNGTVSNIDFPQYTPGGLTNKKTMGLYQAGNKKTMFLFFNDNDIVINRDTGEEQSVWQDIGTNYAGCFFVAGSDMTLVEIDTARQRNLRNIVLLTKQFGTYAILLVKYI